MTAAAEIRQAALKAGWVHRSLSHWADEFTRAGVFMPVQARMVATLDPEDRYEAQERIVVHYTEPFSVQEAIFQDAGAQSLLKGNFVDVTAKTKGRDRKGQVIAWLQRELAVTA
jgi:ribosomal protein L3